MNTTTFDLPRRHVLQRRDTLDWLFAALVLLGGLTPLPKEPFWRNAVSSGAFETVIVAAIVTAFCSVLSPYGLNLPFQLSCICGRRDWIQGHREIIQRYIQGHVEGLLRFNTNAGYFEGYNGSGWGSLSGASGGARK